MEKSFCASKKMRFNRDLAFQRSLKKKKKLVHEQTKEEKLFEATCRVGLEGKSGHKNRKPQLLIINKEEKKTQKQSPVKLFLKLTPCEWR